MDASFADVTARPPPSSSGRALHAAERAYAAVRLVSVDVALAALGGGVMATRIVGTAPRPVFFALLPASVWVVYTLDHLLDARHMGPTAATPRHRFHGRHAAILWPIVTLAALACGVVGLRALATPGILFGLAIGALFLLHELLVKLAGNRASPLLVKELGVAVIFTAGTWGLPVVRRAMTTGHAFDWPVIVAAQYGLLALVNLIAFSLYEADQDTAAGQTSFVRGVGHTTAARVAAILLLAQLPLAALAWHNPAGRPIRAAELVLLGMTLGLAALLRWPHRFARHERYRTLGDGVFLLPLLMAWS